MTDLNDHYWNRMVSDLTVIYYASANILNDVQGLTTGFSDVERGFLMRKVLV
ncbi:hypothetical protein [Type-D symbiont of Plautia stali]|uniref:hypothetical protein n=1 Tax=Type-D symbiont of Plautia stali TaxID=1560356 RepID=UPI0014289097|nr:hypothetical protein [Type-D symbiont of Plautia stali]